MKTTFAIFAALVVSAQMGVACQQPARLSGMEAEMLAWINAQRESGNLPVLKKNAKLDRAAQAHACDMAERGYFAHQRKGGPDLGARLRAEGYRYLAAAENIAKLTSEDVTLAAGLWRDSPGHWTNILNQNVREIGIGIAKSGNEVFWVMNVGKSN